MQPTYPGVYIQEIPSGVHTIVSVATSMTSFVDYFKEGPMDEATDIYGMADFQRQFGGLDPNSEASYAISHLFLNGGSHAIVVRCAGGNEKSDPPLAKASVGIPADTDSLGVSAKSEGVWGNCLRVEIDHDV